MRTTAHQERTAIIILNALSVCAIAAGYYDHEFDGDATVAYFRGSVPFVAFGLVLVRLVAFAEHVLLHDAQIYTNNSRATTATLSSQMRVYQTSLLLGHGLFITTLLLELWSFVEQAPGSDVGELGVAVLARGGGYLLVVAPGASLALQAAEAWAYHCDVKRETSHKIRLPSSQSMV